MKIMFDFGLVRRNQRERERERSSKGSEFFTGSEKEKSGKPLGASGKILKHAPLRKGERASLGPFVILDGPCPRM